MFMQGLDTEITVATARGTTTSATAVSANLLVDERQMNALFLDVVSCSIILTVSIVITFSWQKLLLHLNGYSYKWHITATALSACHCLIHHENKTKLHGLGYIYTGSSHK